MMHFQRTEKGRKFNVCQRCPLQTSSFLLVTLDFNFERSPTVMTKIRANLQCMTQ